jgi:hypothetical protein
LRLRKGGTEDVGLAVAIRTTAQDRKVAGIDRESKARSNGSGQVREQLDRSLDHRSALLTDEVGVGICGELVCRRAVPEVRVHDHAEPLELIEIAIDGRQVDVRGARLDSFRKLLGGQMLLGLEKGLEQDPTRRGRTSPIRAQQFENVVNGRDGAERNVCPERLAHCEQDTADLPGITTSS